MGLRLLSRPMQLLQRSLHIKLMLSAMLVIALIMAFSVYILYLGHTEEQAQKASTRMQENLSKLFSCKLPEPHSTTDLGKITPDAIDPNLDTLICRADGQLSWSSLHMPEVVQARDTICQDLMNYLGGLDQDYFFKRHTIKNGESYFIYSLRFLRNHGDGPTTYYVVMVDSAKRYLAQTRNYLYQCIRQALLAYSLLGALLLLTSFWSLTSLRTMARQIDEIRAGKREALSNDYEREALSNDYERELTPLTESVNQLLENERQQSQRYQHALNDLAHSLKTRLALIQITAQEVKLGHDIHDNINEQILTMDQIIQYQLRRAVTGRQRLASKGTEPVPLIEKLLASLAKVYRHKKLQTRFKFDDDVFFAGEQGDLMELMGNLLDNAFKFAISEIQVTVSRRLDRLRIEIEDDGPGIDPDRSQQIFQRGVRADSSPGQGIGLAVVTELVHSYGGQIMVDESPLGGARFTLDLP
ncbi:two-component system sensor histidine kinase PhoQ [Aeromonas salmonicida subsp. salmonicida A449]|uniref:histidine kinase n=1 Tax=Aeromonas salmonicida (strain A449) TaxID=382245 RepID=A4SKK4_AERS4|nr:ATP-binding protein [Aeromonas salmonicida]ABO89426.1 two-component system sensor histidine kinase PhoQ [Aeromonas salmonicida subsp. salmonicida A449]KTA88551.1 histidine kinase [Aeromonas salmonicida subsp. salmonicida]